MKPADAGAHLEPGKLPDEAVVQDLFTNGIPASIDSDPVHDSALVTLLDMFEISVRFGQRAGLLRQWLALSSVTLEQSTWLLLGRDPFEPSSLEPEPPPAPAFLTRQYQTLLNLLECEVVAGHIRPVGKHVLGFARRFNLLGVAKASLHIEAARSAAEHIRVLSSEQPTTRTSTTEAYQTVRIRQRLSVHLALVQSIRERSPTSVMELAPKSRRSRRRKDSGHAPLNVRIAMREATYIELFKQLYPTIVGGAPDYELGDDMLFDDREMLNIKFGRGRPLKSTSAPTASE